MLLVECVYASYRETNLPLTFIPLLQHEAQTCRILCYRRLKRHGCSTGASNCDYMVQCMPVSMTFKRSWALLLSLMCTVETEDSCFRYTDMMHARYRCWYRSIFFNTDTEPMPMVSVDTKYPVPVSVSP